MFKSDVLNRIKLVALPSYIDYEDTKRFSTECVQGGDASAVNIDHEYMIEVAAEYIAGIMGVAVLFILNPLAEHKFNCHADKLRPCSTVVRICSDLHAVVGLPSANQ